MEVFFLRINLELCCYLNIYFEKYYILLWEPNENLISFYVWFLL